VVRPVKQVVVVVDGCSVVETRQIVGLQGFTQRKYTAVRTEESFPFWRISCARVDATASSTGILEGGFQTTGATIEMPENILRDCERSFCRERKRYSQVV
jgi:hypothetical protein